MQETKRTRGAGDAEDPENLEGAVGPRVAWHLYKGHKCPARCIVLESREVTWSKHVGQESASSKIPSTFNVGSCGKAGKSRAPSGIRDS